MSPRGSRPHLSSSYAVEPSSTSCIDAPLPRVRSPATNLISVLSYLSFPSSCIEAALAVQICRTTPLVRPEELTVSRFPPNITVEHAAIRQLSPCISISSTRPSSSWPSDSPRPTQPSQKMPSFSPRYYTSPRHAPRPPPTPLRIPLRSLGSPKANHPALPRRCNPSPSKPTSRRRTAASHRCHNSSASRHQPYAPCTRSM